MKEDYYLTQAREFIVNHLSIDDEQSLRKAAYELAMLLHRTSQNTLRNALKT
jgi:hypothetical protein